MPRYIDADKLCEGRVSNYPVVIAAKCEPTADVRELVFCKDCQHRRRLKFSKYTCKFSPVIPTNDFGFCCHGRERKDKHGI